MVETNYNEYFKHYIELVNSQEPLDALNDTEAEFTQLLATVSEEKGLFRYEEGKWTIKEVLAHVIDAERVFAYRAMSFARNDSTNLAGFNDKFYAKNSGANKRKVIDLKIEFNFLRKSTLALFNSFDEAMWLQKGEANNITIDVKSLAYLIAGHGRHHGDILNKRYLGNI